MTKYLIIGGSAGGIGAVEAIREIDSMGTLTIISEENVPQYSRPMISEYVSKEVTLDKMKYRGDLFWKNNNVQTLTGRTAVKIDFTKKQVELDGGDKIDFPRSRLQEQAGRGRQAGRHRPGRLLRGTARHQDTEHRQRAERRED